MKGKRWWIHMMQLGALINREDRLTGVEKKTEIFGDILYFPGERKSFALTSQHQLPESILTEMEGGLRKFAMAKRSSLSSI